MIRPGPREEARVAVRKAAPGALPKRLRGSVRRALLIEAADDLLRTGGIKALTMERLALAANISKPVVYSHFRNRSDMIIALLQEYWAYVDRRGDADRPIEYNEAGARRWVSVYLDVMLERGAAYRQLLYKVLEDPHVEAARSARDVQVIARITETVLATYDIAPREAKAAATMFRSALEACGVQVVGDARLRPLIEKTFVKLVVSTLKALAN
jgi:AcrR family transcriptional regulator